MATGFPTTAHIYGMPIKKAIGGQGLKEPGRIDARAYVTRQRGLSRKGAFARRRRYGRADEVPGSRVRRCRLVLSKRFLGEVIEPARARAAAIFQNVKTTSTRSHKRAAWCGAV